MQYYCILAIQTDLIRRQSVWCYLFILYSVLSIRISWKEGEGKGEEKGGDQPPIILYIAAAAWRQSQGQMQDGDWVRWFFFFFFFSFHVFCTPFLQDLPVEYQSAAWLIPGSRGIRRWMPVNNYSKVDIFRRWYVWLLGNCGCMMLEYIMHLILYYVDSFSVLYRHTLSMDTPWYSMEFYL